MLVSFADEAGMHTNQDFPYVVIAGYFATEEIWRGFNAEWCEALRGMELDEFHMTKFLGGTDRPYCEWSEKDNERNIHRLISIITQHSLRGFANQVSRADYNNVLSEQIRHRVLKDPYLALFDRTVRGLLDRLYSDPSGNLELKREKLAMFFGRTSLSKKAEHRFEVIQKDHPQGQHLVGTPIFVKSADFLPIQAADMLSSVASAFMRGKFHGSLDWDARTESYLRRLCVSKRMTFHKVTIQSLEATERRYQRAKLARSERPNF